MSDERLCGVCRKPEDAHGGPSIVHAFTPEGERVDTSQFARKRPKDDDKGDDPGASRGMTMGYTQTPFDPVLRQALIDAGVITMEQLEEAQRKIGLLTNQVTGGGGRGGRTRSG